MKRLFIANSVLLSEEYQDLILRLKRGMIRDKVVWVDSKVQHLTIRFLGKTPDDKIDILSNILQQVAQESSPFNMTIDKLGMFGSRYKPTVLWLGFSQIERYLELFNRLEQLLIMNGFEANSGNFVPHITIGRIKGIDNNKKFQALLQKEIPEVNQIISIAKLTLFQSKLTSEGPIYHVINEFPFTTNSKR